MLERLLEKLQIGGLLTVGGLLITLVGWWISEWPQYNSLDDLLIPLGRLLRYGGLGMLLVGLAWSAMQYYRRLSATTPEKK